MTIITIQADISHSRIDYVFQLVDSLVYLDKIERGSRIYSDHAPIMTEWQILGKGKQFRPWRLDNFLLLNQEVKRKIQEEIMFYHCNDDTKVLLWETFKPYIRGIFIN